MKKITAIIVLFTLFVCANAQVSFTHNNRGVLRVVGSNVIRQDINSGDIVEAVFYIQNISADTVYIGQVSPDCQCTQFSYPSTGIKPRSSDSVVLFFQSKNTPPGPYHRKNIVDFDDTSFELIIEGNITVKRPIIKAGQRPIIYEPKQIRVLNNPTPTLTVGQ